MKTPLPIQLPAPGRDARRGFTLVELLLALAIFSMIMTIVASTYLGVVRSWLQGTEAMEQLHYGEYVAEQLESALRSAAWFSSKPEAFGFWLDSTGGTSRDAANEVSWVTSGSAFLLPDSPYQNGLHRIAVTVSGTGDERGLLVKTWSHLEEETEAKDVEGDIVSDEIRGFHCQWYNFAEERWSQEWEETNSLPKLVQFTLVMKPREAFEKSMEIKRLVELEVAPELPGQEQRAPIGPQHGVGRGNPSGSGGGQRNPRTNTQQPGEPRTTP